MILICGLGNPGNKYKYTRHNVGFLLLDFIADEERFAFQKEKRFKGLGFKGKLNKEDAFYLMPETFMNLSGDSVLPVVSFFKLHPQNVIVIHDDVDLPFGTIKLKMGGGSGGHNGLKSIQSKIGNNFVRIRIGIGRPKNPHMDTADYVLQPFSREEMTEIPDLLYKSIDMIKYFVEHGLEKSMNQYH